DRLHEEVQPHPTVRRLRIGDRKGARQIRPPLVPAPPRVRGEHVELARGGHRARLIECREDPIAARGKVPGHLAETSPEGGNRSLSETRDLACGHLCDGSRSCGGSWSSWRERTG